MNINITANTTKTEEEIFDGGVQTFLIVSAFVLVNFALILNISLLLILTFKKQIRKKTYTVLVLHLSVADTTVTVGAIGWVLVQRFSPRSAYLCGIVISLAVFGLFLSIYYTFIISLNRYLSIANTTLNTKLSDGKRKYALLYIPSVAVGLANMIFSVTWKESIAQCSMHTIFGASPSAFGIFVAALYFPVLFCTVVIYVFAIRAIRKHFSQVLPLAVIPRTSNGGPSGQNIRQKREMASLKTVGVIIILLMILTSPILFLSVFSMLQFQLDRYFYVTCGLGALMNSAFNPIVYTWRMKEVRQEIHRIFTSCCRFCKNWTIFL